jgi:Cd2+/Zn2+-exporting ATPase
MNGGVKLINVKKEYSVKNLHCAGCATKLEGAISELHGVQAVSLNFMTKKLIVEVLEEKTAGFLEIINTLADRVEPGTVFEEMRKGIKKLRIKVKGLHCAGCASKIEGEVSKLSYISGANLNFTKQLLHLEVEDIFNDGEIIADIKNIVNSLEPGVEVIYGDESCGHDHSHEDQHDHDHSHGEMNKTELISLIIGGVIFIAGLFISDALLIKRVLLAVGYVAVGGDIVLNSFKNIKKGRFLDENFLMTIATFGAFAVGEYSEAVGVMLFYKIGEYFQGRAVENSRKSIESLMDIRPDYANIKKASGEIERVKPERVLVGDIILVKPGEKIPLDGRVLNGSSALDTSALTGESLPRDVVTGDEVLSGSVNKNGVLEIEVSKRFSESTVSKILEMVENATSKKADSEKFITKFARYYTPAVVGLAVAIAVIPGIITGNYSEWFYRALIFLVISCPCALVVSIPLSFFSGIGAASKKGVLIKGGNYLEALNKVKAVVFDKTGTLTKGRFKVVDVFSVFGKKEELLELAAVAETYSNHPIAKSIMAAFKGEIEEKDINEYSEEEGYGIKVRYKNVEILAGNNKLLEKYGIEFKKEKLPGTVVYIAKNSVYQGYILIADEVKEDAGYAVQVFKKMGIVSYMLTGDNRNVAEHIGKTLGIERIHSDLLPNEKVDYFQRIKEEVQGGVIFVGDGINDAPVLALSDIGVAMGGIGSDAAIEAADMVIMTDEPSKLKDAFNIAGLTRKIVLQNIILALGIKLAVMALGVGGHATMWEAIFADVGVALLAVLNSMRILKNK